MGWKSSTRAGRPAIIIQAKVASQKHSGPKRLERRESMPGLQLLLGRSIGKYIVNKTEIVATSSEGLYCEHEKDLLQGSNLSQICLTGRGEEERGGRGTREKEFKRGK